MTNTVESAAEAAERLAGELVTRARSAGALDLSFGIADGPGGELLVVTSNRGVCRVGFALQGFDELLDEEIARRGARVLRGGPIVVAACREIEAYGRGALRTFTVDVDLSATAGFRRETLDALRDVGWCERLSYAELAQRAGRPKAVRAAASACSHNPVPIIVPCHRVVRADGLIGNYLGGSDLKATLLALEAG